MKNQLDTMKDNFYLEYQPIVRIQPDGSNEMTHFEVLLRSNENHRYPEDIFNLYITCNDTNRIIMKWYADQLLAICEKYPLYSFNFNIHPFQFNFDSTWEILEQLKHCVGQIHLEITENISPIHLSTSGKDLSMKECIEKAKSLGFKIGIDDVSTGQNTLELVLDNIEVISCIKFSLRSFLDLDEETLDLFLTSWQTLAEKHQLAFVVEGVEDKRISDILFQRGIILQQGYYWAKSVEL